MHGRLLLTLPLWVSVAAAQVQVPVSVEERIVQQVEDGHEHALELLERSVNVNSGTRNLAGVRAVGKLFAEEFEALGFATEWIDGAAFNRAGHLLASRGDSGPKILLIGHLDTVFTPDSPLQRFERVDEYFARGPGNTDMKGGNVVMLQALRALREAGVMQGLSIRAVLTGDEESQGHPVPLRTAALIEAAKWADYAIGFEDGDGDPATAVISRRGTTDWILTVSGTSGHSSQVFQPEFGYGAVYEAARILDAFREALAGEPNLTLNPGLIAGGTEAQPDAAEIRASAFGKTNVIAGTVWAKGDLRTISTAQREAAKRRMREIIADNLLQTNAEIVFIDGYPPMAPSDGNRQLLGLFDQVSRDLGLGAVAAVDPRNAGAADISYAAEHVKMAMDGVGLMGSGGHTIEETADLRTLDQQSKRVAVLLYRLSQMQ
ncbi:MAG: M20 family metallopeptidase [Gammaproteobacteria bacterium]|nr:MAG: M20 family metallopeptidase [Gammaproteobacteria bacterium]